MALAYGLLVGLTPVLLLAAGLVPGRWAEGDRSRMRRLAVIAPPAAFGCATTGAVLLGVSGPLDVALVSWSWPVPLNLGVYFDSLTAVMCLLVTFIGSVIAGFSVRSLDGDARQGQFLRGLLFTLGAVTLMIVSRNLVMLTLSWMLTSFGLHRLLTHYPERPWAIWAARKKFLISRLGDVLLVAALALTYHRFGSFDYRDVFAACQELAASSNGGGWQVALIGVLFAVGAMTKSAQVPFHSWLPETMEAPTPVSALMHAGVINAGGFLVIRLSPLLSQSPVALDCLGAVGGLTAVVGVLVMLTQTTVKRSLAYSTIAQMGFMMLQCGLGAFSAALLHIVAHSLYKTHAFLSSGSVLDSAAGLRIAPTKGLNGAAAGLALPAALLLGVGIAGGSAWLWGVAPAEKPGFVVLGLVLILALAQLVWQSLRWGSWQIAARGVLAAVFVSSLYLGAWTVFDHLLSLSISHQVVAPSPWQGLIAGGVAISFACVFLLQATAGALVDRPVVRALYVHAANGFYLDIPARRLTARLWGGRTPTP